jgi:long-chain acyl-CoA synthetase
MYPSDTQFQTPSGDMQSSDEALLGQSLGQLLDSLPPRISTPLFHWAEQKPAARAVRDHTGRCLTYAEMAQQVRSAQQVLSELGVGPGDRVLLINENCVTLTVIILALSEIGAWSVIVNARMAPPELEKIQRHCQPRATLYLLESNAARSHWETSGKEGGPRQSVELDSVQVGYMLDQDAAVDAADMEAGISNLIYTTGTTGDPKGVMLTHRNILYVAAITSVLRGMREDDRIYAVLPISHVFGLAAVFLASLYVGAELVLADRFDAGQAFSTLRSEQITGMFGVPTIFAKMLEHAASHPIAPADMPRLRFIYSGGAPLDPRIKADTGALFGIPLLNAYGMTESGPTICQVRFNERPDSCTVGRPLPGLSVKVLGADGREVAAGETGELHIRGPNIMRGYFRNPEATRSVIDADGFLNTGDLVRFDAAGCMHIMGRSKELIIHSGFNVYPPEVEAVIARHPEVVICAVVGKAVDGNEEVIAYIQRAAGSTLDAETLGAFIRPDLAAYKRPSRIFFMDTLPTAPSGKVLKHQLARLLV